MVRISAFVLFVGFPVSDSPNFPNCQPVYISVWHVRWSNLLEWENQHGWVAGQAASLGQWQSPTAAVTMAAASSGSSKMSSLWMGELCVRSAELLSNASVCIAFSCLIFVNTYFYTSVIFSRIELYWIPLSFVKTILCFSLSHKNWSVTWLMQNIKWC